ncbi:MAG: ATP-binding protein, partial [Phototrophicaceae bacterium]
MQTVRTILLVSNGVAYQERLNELLPQLQMPCHLANATSFESALDVLESNSPPDFLLVAPPLSVDTSLLNHPKLKAGGIPIILLMEEVTTSQYEHAIKAGAADVLDTQRLDALLLWRTLYYALDRAKTLQQLRQNEADLRNRVTQLDLLRRVDAELTATLNITSVANLALDSAMRLSGAEVGIMALYDADNDTLEVILSLGIMPNSPLLAAFVDRQGAVGRVLQSHQAALTVDVRLDPTITLAHDQIMADMVIPMQSSERLVGLLALQTRRAERFTQEVFEFIGLMTGRIAVSVDNARLYELQRLQLEQMRALYEQVSALEQIKTDMIRIASHDLRNPIGVVRGYAELIINENFQISKERLRNYILAIDKSTGRMERITSDILSLQRFEENAITVEPVDLVMVARAAFHDQTDSAQNKQQSLLLDIPSVSTNVLGDLGQLHEAVANLISNAIKYTPTAGTIEVSLENDGDAAIFMVADNGYGIPDDMQARLFQPFYRAKTRETAQIEGTGLGLHLVKNIIERHKGRMIFRSRYNEGSVFGFQIPII